MPARPTKWGEPTGITISGNVSVLGRRRNDIEAEAADWIIRLERGPLLPEEQQVLERWLAEDPLHRAEFDRARSTWAELAALGAVGDEPADCHSIASERRGVPTPGWRHWMAAGALRAAAAVSVVVLGAGLGLFWIGDPLILVQADHRTAPGESRSVTLADGSLVQLGTDSALAVRFDEGARRVALLAGQAYFAVAPMRDNETRPFVVEAANGSATALGTEFMVDRTVEGADVTVVEHRVRVFASASGDAGQSVVLSSGQSVHYDRTGGMEAPTNANLQRATAWRRGELVFDKARLADVIAELNRYRRGRIVVADAGLADRRVSGYFPIGDLDEALASMIRELDVRAVSLPPFVTVLY